MRSVLEFLVQFIVALTGAVGGAIVLVGGIAAACGAGVMCTGWCVRRLSGAAARRRRRSIALRDDPAPTGRDEAAPQPPPAETGSDQA